MILDYVAIILSLPLVYLLFRFSSRPTYKMLIAFLALSIAYFIAINYLYIITLYSTLRIILLYSIACYFILSFIFQNNVYQYYDVVGLTVGWDEFKIPLILWEFSDDFSFISILGIPIWRPFSYISKLRNSYNKIDLVEYEKTQNSIPNSITTESQIQVTGCKFNKLVREDTKEKYGNCYLVFFGPLRITKFIGYADRSLLKVKLVRGSQDSYNVSYISMLGWAPKLNQKDSYDLFGKFSPIPTEDKPIPGIYIRAIRKHSKGFSPNLFIHWLSIVIYLLLSIILFSILKFNAPALYSNNLSINGNMAQSIAEKKSSLLNDVHTKPNNSKIQVMKGIVTKVDFGSHTGYITVKNSKKEMIFFGNANMNISGKFKSIPSVDYKVIIYYRKTKSKDTPYIITKLINLTKSPY